MYGLVEPLIEPSKKKKFIKSCFNCNNIHFYDYYWGCSIQHKEFNRCNCRYCNGRCEREQMENFVCEDWKKKSW